MQVFERVGDHDLITHYEYFLMNYDWSQSSLPDQIGDWNLLGGSCLSDCDGLLQLNAVYRTSTANYDRVVYIDLAGDLLMRMVVGQSLEEISNELPSAVLENIVVGQGTSASDWKS